MNRKTKCEPHETNRLNLWDPVFLILEAIASRLEAIATSS